MGDARSGGLALSSVRKHPIPADDESQYWVTSNIPSSAVLQKRERYTKRQVIRVFKSSPSRAFKKPDQTGATLLRMRRECPRRYQQRDANASVNPRTFALSGMIAQCAIANIRSRHDPGRAQPTLQMRELTSSACGSRPCFTINSAGLRLSAS